MSWKICSVRCTGRQWHRRDNPDIFIYAIKNYYYNKYLSSTLKNFVTTIVFDEFHLYDLRQRI